MHFVAEPNGSIFLLSFSLLDLDFFAQFRVGTWTQKARQSPTDQFPHLNTRSDTFISRLGEKVVNIYDME
jgi:hypothetical protein